MLTNFIKNSILSYLSFTPNEGQDRVLDRLSVFLSQCSERPCFVLTGYAGTGKTSLVSALTRALCALQQPPVLLAPTGRAAKVMSHYAGCPAYTIHKWIYHTDIQPDQNVTLTFSLGFNKAHDTLFIVDEASMLHRDLLDDLVRFVYQGEHCKLLLLGDEAQLPPIEYTQSPALQIPVLENYGLSVSSARLKEVVRQAQGSGILQNATRIREAIVQQQCLAGHELDLIVPAEDVALLPPQRMVEEIERSYNEVGVDQTLIITRSNKRTNLYNQGVRNQLLWRENQLQTGDRIMVSRNNYYFAQQYANLPFLANGDMLEVVRLRNERELYGQHFADASLKSLDYEWEIDVVLWLDSLITDTPEMNYAKQKELYAAIAEDYPEIRNKKDLREKITSSPYFNALQVRYAYAVTCHKAQGGQWKNVFIDPGLCSAPVKEQQGENKEQDYRWMYTALTRATEKVYLLKNK